MRGGSELLWSLGRVQTPVLAMIVRRDDEAELRESLRKKGLGTPATIETLLHRKYIRRNQKNILATDLGRSLIAIVQNRNLTSPQLTGQWEAKLKQIETGKHSAEVFMRAIVQYTRELIESNENTRLDEQTYGPCPGCGNNVVKGKRSFGCSG